MHEDSRAALACVTVTPARNDRATTQPATSMRQLGAASGYTLREQARITHGTLLKRMRHEPPGVISRSNPTDSRRLACGRRVAS
jgi:hypothetical protein